MNKVLINNLNKKKFFYMNKVLINNLNKNIKMNHQILLINDNLKLLQNKYINLNLNKIYIFNLFY